MTNVSFPDGSFRTIGADVPAEPTIAALQSRATTALTNNATFLAIATPTNAQVLAQVQALTRQVNALIRLAVGALDSTVGT